MIEIKITSKDLDRLAKTWPHSNAIVDEEMNRAMNESVLVLRGRAVEEAPTGVTSILRNSIFSNVEGDSDHIRGIVGVGPGAPHGICVEGGTKPHWAPIAPLKLWARRILGDEKAAYAVQRKIAKVGTKANPFMQRAADKEQGRIDAFFAAAGTRTVQRMGSL
jgi:hypothetical protein